MTQQTTNNARTKVAFKELSGYGYEVLGTLGEGAFGVVIKARHTSSKETVAIKVISKKELKRGEFKKIQREVRSMKKLRKHPNIINLIECKETSSFMFLVLEFCRKGDLLEYVQSKQRLTEPEALILFRQLVNGIEHAHNTGIIHRDIKLENLLLAHDGTLRIADWGFARSWSPSSLIKEYPGSLHYASPEIVLATPYTGPEVDIWSMGVTLYALCSGCLPFFGQDDDLIVDRIATSNFPMFHTFSKDLKDLLTQMLDCNESTRLTMEQVKSHPWFSCREVLANGITRVRSRSLVAQVRPPVVPALKLLVENDNQKLLHNKIVPDENIVVTPKGIVTYRRYLSGDDTNNANTTNTDLSILLAESSDDEKNSGETNRDDDSKDNNNENNNENHCSEAKPKNKKRMQLFAPLLKLIGKGAPPTKKKENLAANKEAFNSPYI